MKTRAVRGKDLEDGMTLVGFMDKTATISRVSKGKKYVHFYNDVLGLKDRVGLHDEVTVVEVSHPEPLFLVCQSCGEAFSSIVAAYEHGVFIPGSDPSWCGENGFLILPESEAF